MTNTDTLNQIVQTLSTKSVLKQDIYTSSLTQFQELKWVANQLVNEIKDKLPIKDKRITIEYLDKGLYEFRIKVAGDVLIFHQHTNVFKFDENHPILKTSYLAEDPNRAYCSIINIYNFLSDSFKYNRVNDTGYLIGRIFINKEGHFLTEGKRKLGFLYHDFSHQVFEEPHMKTILEHLIVHVLEFDLYTPPYETVKEASVYEIKSIGDTIQLKTGKRIGFQFSFEKD